MGADLRNEKSRGAGLPDDLKPGTGFGRQPGREVSWRSLNTPLQVDRLPDEGTYTRLSALVIRYFGDDPGVEAVNQILTVLANTASIAHRTNIWACVEEVFSRSQP